MNRTIETRTTLAGQHLERVRPRSLTIDDIVFSPTGRPHAVVAIRAAAQPGGGRATEVDMREVSDAVGARLGEVVTKSYAPSQTVEVSAQCSRHAHPFDSCAVTKPYRHTCRDCGRVVCSNLEPHPSNPQQCSSCYHMDEYAVGLL